MFLGALFDTWWQRTPVAAILSARRSSHFFPEADEGSNSRIVRALPPTLALVSANMLSSSTSPKSDDHRSMCRTPGKRSLVNCGKSSSVISPYFFFIAAPRSAASDWAWFCGCV